MCCNSSSIFTCSSDQNILSYSLSDDEFKSSSDLIKKNSSVLQIVASDSNVFVLYNDRSVENLKADDISQVVSRVDKVEGLKGDVVDLAYIEAKNELWVTDDKGYVQVLNGDTLAPLDASLEL